MPMLADLFGNFVKWAHVLRWSGRIIFTQAALNLAWW